MKKRLSIVLIAVLCVILSCSAFAAGKLKDGTYSPKFTCTGGSGRGGIAAVSLNVSGGNMKATITMTSPNYTKAVVGGTTYQKQGGGDSQFTFPVSALDTDILVVATTEAMAPNIHEIKYTLNINSSSLPESAYEQEQQQPQQPKETPKQPASTPQVIASQETPSSSVPESTSAEPSSTEASSSSVAESSSVTTIGADNGGGVSPTIIVLCVVVAVVIIGGIAFYFLKVKKGNK